MHLSTESFLILIVLSWFSCQSNGTKVSPKPGNQSHSPIENLTLSDFHPKSVFNIPVTQVKSAKYPAIDFHSHHYAKTPQEIARWVETMDSVGIDKSIIQTYATGTRFDSIYDLYAAFPDRFILFCGFDYTGYDEPGFGPAAVTELERCVRKGARGVGELGDKGKGLFYSHPTPAFGMHIDDPRMDPLIRKCGAFNIPVSIHVAEPIWMYLPMDSTNDGLINAFKWRLDNQAGILDHGAMVKTLENGVSKHPETTFVACHYANCSYDLDLLGRLFDIYPNLFADIGARFGETAPIPRKVNRFFTQYQDRLLYGTDMGMAKAMYRVTFRILETEDEHFYDRENFNYHWPLHGYGLTDNILQKVYRSNADKILRL